MLFIMQKMKVINRAVVCTRFKGGANIGSQRFKVINDCVIEVLKLEGDNLEIE